MDTDLTNNYYSIYLYLVSRVSPPIHYLIVLEAIDGSIVQEKRTTMEKSFDAQCMEAAKRFAQLHHNQSDPFAFRRMLTHLRNGIERLGGDNGVLKFIESKEAVKPDFSPLVRR